jgi:nitrate reductase delta subunit
MSVDDKIYEHLASILSYPEEQIREGVEKVHELAPVEVPTLKLLSDYLEGASTKSVEELFTRTFDLNPSCCLEVGWHLYGEDYPRGAFLVNMRQTLAEENLPESPELPDHLSHCLRLLPKLEAEDAEAFARKYILPAVGKILPAMEDENPYTCVLEMLQSLLEGQYGPGDPGDGIGNAKLVELPILDNVLHYNNTEDLQESGKKRR